MATLQQQLDAINAEIASGQLSVKHGETAKTARPLAELLQIRADIEQRLAEANGSTRIRRTVASYKSGA